MSSLPGVTIDASVLAVPHVSCTKDDAFQYVDTLLDWSKLLDETWVAIYMSERTSEALDNDGLYPFRGHLKKLFKMHGIVEYDVNTVATITEKLLTITPSFEAHYQVEDVLPENLATEPDIINLIVHDCLRSDLVRCIILIAVLRKYCSLPLGEHSLVLRKAPKQVVQVRAQIHDLEHNRDDIPDLPCPPEFFEGDVLVCDDFRGLIECLDESVMLVGASDDLGIELSIRIASFKQALSQSEEPEWETIQIPIIGSEFRKTCQQCCNNTGDSLPPKILRSIIETIEGQNTSAVHALRTGRGGNNPQRMRGSDKAQRRDIDREFRLHYWDCADGRIELASVVYHNDFSIPE